MPSRPSVPKRKRFFIGAEGESERSFAKWLRLLCDKVDLDKTNLDEANLHVYLDIVVCGGGDGFEVASYATKQYRIRTREHGRFAAGLILLDYDRIEQDRLRGRAPEAALKGKDLCLIYLRPNLEGLLLRLHSGREKEFVSARIAEQSLRKLWPEYEKPISADALSDRFSLDDLRRAARHDADLHKVLVALGLMRGR